MIASKSTWFVRFTIKKNDKIVTVSTLVEAETPQKAWAKLVDEQMERHDINSFGIDILSMNKV